LNSTSICHMKLFSFRLLNVMRWVVRRTSQFVAVKGTREKIHPAREGSSGVRRMYLSVLTMVSPPKSNHRLCMSESRYGYPKHLVDALVRSRTWSRGERSVGGRWAKVD
jgi:hypothetical protein